MPTPSPSIGWGRHFHSTMVDCGEYTYRAWKEGEALFSKYLGPFNPNMPREELDRLLEHEKIEPNAVDDFWIGFNRAKEKDGK
jgi:hypothetical protein